MEKLPLNRELGSFELTIVTHMTKSTWNIPHLFPIRCFFVKQS